MPAPQPAYDFPPLAALARLGFPAARAIYGTLQVLAVAACVAALAATAIPIEVAALALLLCAGFMELNAGQIVPFALLALVLAGFALVRRRDEWAGALAALTAIEPHLALPVCIAVLLFVPRARIALVATGLALAAVALWSVGPAVAVEYLTRVLPLHAAAEASYPYQYSLTWVLQYAGVDTHTALLLGNVSYALMAALGIALGVRCAAVLDRRDLLVYLPAAAVVFAGPFIHQVELAFAMPAALVLAVRLDGRARLVAIAAVCLLAVPWLLAWSAKKLLLASLAVCVGVLARLRAPVAFACILVAAIAASLYAFELVPPRLPEVAAATHAYAADALAQVAWADYAAQLTDNAPGWLLVKVPAWLALAGLLGAAFFSGFRGRRTSTQP